MAKKSSNPTKPKTAFKFPKLADEKPKYKLHSLMFDLTSEDYHGISGTWSSSQFKDLLDDETVFIKKYIHKTVEREDIPAFSVGNYFHTGILEPHKLTKDCVVYGGKVRRGKEWDVFASKNVGKVILTPSMRDQAQGLIKSVQDSPVAMGYVNQGKPEVSLFTDLRVFGGCIYAPEYDKKLTPMGWVDCDCSDVVKTPKAVKIIVKVRADSLGEEFILDLKSTTGNARSQSEMRNKISYYSYDLSASLYLDMFALQRPDVKTFVWAFASKDYWNSKTWEASPNNILVGRAKYMKAILKMIDCMKNSWEVADSLGVLEPQIHELEILKQPGESNDADLL